MDVVVRGRHCSVTSRFRRHVESKLTKLERFTQKIIRIDVEVSKERNPRLADRCERVELTVISRGPVVRAEAAAEERHAAFDLALDKLQARLRKAADRRRIHRGNRKPTSVAEATAAAVPGVVDPTVVAGNGAASTPSSASATGSDVSDTEGAADPSVSDSSEADIAPAEGPDSETAALVEVQGDGPLVVREKLHKAEAMTLDQALYEMELVGHDFYLFIDADSQWPSVVYRRRGYDYGVIRLAS